MSAANLGAKGSQNVMSDERETKKRKPFQFEFIS